MHRPDARGPLAGQALRYAAVVGACLCLDLGISGETIRYMPLREVERIVAEAGFSVVATDAWRQLWYAHECLVARRPA